MLNIWYSFEIRVPSTERSSGLNLVFPILFLFLKLNFVLRLFLCLLICKPGALTDTWPDNHSTHSLDGLLYFLDCRSLHLGFLSYNSKLFLY